MRSEKVPVYCVYKNHLQYSPLALGMIVSFARHYKGELLEQYYDFSVSQPAYSDGEDLVAAVEKNGPGIVLFSDYLWTLSYHLESSRRVKQYSAGCITVHGGPSFPKYEKACEEYFQQYPFVDIGIRGEGEVATAELLEQLALHRDAPDRMFLASVLGLTFRDPVSGAIVRTPERPSAREIAELPFAVPIRTFSSGRSVGVARRGPGDEPRMPLWLHVLRLGFCDATENPSLLVRTRSCRNRMASQVRHPGALDSRC